MATIRKTRSLGTGATEILSKDPDLLKEIIQTAIQELLETEMIEAIGAKKGERTELRLGYRAGYYPRSLVTRAGKIELKVPRDRSGRFSTEIFDRYQRSEKALVLAIAEMYVQGVSTRKVKEISEELLGEEISASTVSRLSKSLDEQLQAFSKRKLAEPYPYLILDARYERIRDHGAIRHQAVLVAIGVNWDGKREVLAIELSNRESKSSWAEFLSGLKERGLDGVQMVISDAHEGLKRAVSELLPQALWQRCYVHFLRNALDYLPRKADDDCLTELRWIYDRFSLEEAQKDIRAWVTKWESRYPKLADWVEENIAETLTFYQFPRSHRKHLKSTNMIERFNEEIKRRTYVVRIFPNQASALRLIRALGAEINERWIEEHRYLNMTFLKDREREFAFTVA